MAKNAEVEWNGRQVRQVVHEEIDASLGEGAYTAEATAKRSSRVDTGRMRAATATRRVKPLNWVVFNDVHYSIYNELGTRFTAAAPMLRPGMNAGAVRVGRSLRRKFGR